MRVYMNQSKEDFSSKIENYTKEYESHRFVSPENRKTVKHFGRTYVKVAELTHYDLLKTNKGVLIGCCALAATMLSLGLACIFKDIRKALTGCTFRSIYIPADTSEVDQRIQTVVEKLKDPQVKISYEKQLRKLINDSFRELYHNEKLVAMLSEETDTNSEERLADGREELLSLLKLSELTNFAQLRELEKNAFVINLDDFDRISLFNDTKEKLRLLEPEGKEVLTEKLLKTSNFDLKSTNLPKKTQDLIEDLFKKISTLSGQIHQGHSDCFKDLNEMVKDPQKI